jgi:alkyl hydroperoxide reductase subunit AhpF
MSVDKIPAIILNNSDDGRADAGQSEGSRVRYYGIPAGYEFSSLIEDIIDLSRNQTELSAETKEALQELEEDLHIQVFVTPT